MTHYQKLEYQRQYHKEHREQEKAYYEANREKYNEYCRNYYRKNKMMWKEVYSPEAQIRAIIKGAKNE